MADIYGDLMMYALHALYALSPELYAYGMSLLILVALTACLGLFAAVYLYVCQLVCFVERMRCQRAGVSDSSEDIQREVVR